MENKGLNDLARVDRQFPLEPYIRFLHTILRQEGSEAPHVAVDRGGIVVHFPHFHKLVPAATWVCDPINRPRPMLSGEESLQSDVVPESGCVCGDCQAARDHDKVTNISLMPRDWIGHFVTEFCGVKVHVVGIVLGNEYADMGNFYVVGGPSQHIVAAFLSDMRRMLYEAEEARAREYICVNDGLGIPRPSLSWDSVVLAEGQKELIEGNVAGFFRGKETYQRYGLPYRRGILLVGPPGNGKSTVLRILASKYRDLAFFLYGFSDKDNYVERIKALFERASRMSPAVIILEDIDRVVNDHMMRGFLNLMDGLTSPQGVMVIATSNNAAKIDEALIERPSRFDVVIRFDNPDSVQRLTYLTTKLKDFPGASEEKIAALAESCNKYSMAMLQELFTGALLRGVGKGINTATWTEVEESREQLGRSLATAAKEHGKSTKGTSVGFSGGIK